MAEAEDPPNTPPNSPQSSGSDAGDRDPAEITATAAAHLLAVGRALSRSARGAWEPPSVADLQRMLPQYEIRALIGRGGMGAVYRGMQRSLDRDVAIKILPTEMAAEDAQFPERFKREGKAMARLSHPGIVTVFDAGETAEGLLYFVMEFVEGTDVQAMLMARGPLPAAEVLPIVAHVCDALEFAHASGFIHRDIKPSNIMVDDRGRVKVADFGLARAMAVEGVGLTGDTMTICTAEFAAPEAFVPGEALDGRADIYSVGVMLYHLLTGQIPRGRFEGPSTRMAGLDPRIDAIVDRAMQADRERRYSTARELRADLDRILTGALLTEGSSREGGTRVLNGWLLIGAGVAATVVILAAALIFQGGTRSRAPGQATANVADAIAATSTPAATAYQRGLFVNSLGMRFRPVPIVGEPSGGSPEGTDPHLSRTPPPRRVLFSVWATRVQDYQLFADETKRSWEPPRYPQSPAHPAVNVSWTDAKAFCEWLTARERMSGSLGASARYRLPTDHEWSCAVGIGEREDPAQTPKEKSSKIADVFPWGTGWPPPPLAGNYSGEEAVGHETGPSQKIVEGYRDDFPEAAPVGSFAANRFGLFDLGGNVKEWCEDLWTPEEAHRVSRGIAFNDGSRDEFLSSRRRERMPEDRLGDRGFRLVLEDAPSVPPVAGPAWRPVPFKLNARMEGGFVHLVKFESWAGTRFLIANAAVRAVIAWQPELPGRNDYIKVVARWSDTDHYYAHLTGPSVEVGVFQGRKVTPLQRWPVTPPAAEGEVIPLQLACIGQHLAVWVRGRLVGTFDDATLTSAGNVGVQASDGHIQNLEYINLDGLSESDALKLLGVPPAP